MADEVITTDEGSLVLTGQSNSWVVDTPFAPVARSVSLVGQTPTLGFKDSPAGRLTITGQAPAVAYVSFMDIEAELTVALDQFNFEESALLSTMTLYSTELLSLLGADTYIYPGATPGVEPTGYGAELPVTDYYYPPGNYPPDTWALPAGVTAVGVPFPKHKRETWALRAVFLTDTALGVYAGYTHDNTVIYSCSISAEISDAGTAEVELGVIDTHLAGSTVQIQVSLNDGSWTPVFTGWLLADSPVSVDHIKMTTRYQLSDGLSWLGQNRLAFSKTYGGKNLDGNGANAIEAAIIEMNRHPEVFTAENIKYPTREGPEPPVYTRQQIIEDILTIAGYTQGSDFSSTGDGGYLGWEVAVSEETPLDVIRQIAESVRWQFRVSPTGVVVFEPCYIANRSAGVTFDDVIFDTLKTEWGKTPVNNIQVKGVSKSYKGLDWTHKEIGKIPVGILSYNLTVSSGLWTPQVGQPYMVSGTNGAIEMFRYNSPDHMPVKNVSWGGRPFYCTTTYRAKKGMVEAYHVDLLPGTNGSFGDVVIGQDIVNSSYADVLVWANMYDVPPINRSGYLYYWPNVMWLGWVLYPSNMNISMTVVTDANGEETGYHMEFSGGAVGSVNLPLEISVIADVLEFVDRDHQASVELTDTGSIAAFGKYKQVVYENPFISSNEQALLAAQQIINTSHRMGELTFDTTYQERFLSGGVGARMTMIDEDMITIQEGIIESLNFSFESSGLAKIGMKVSTEYETE